jgi:hypothetical protein
MHELELAPECWFNELRIVRTGLSPNSLALPADLTERQWEEIGQGLGKVGHATQWWIGDWWAFGVHKYGDRRKLVESEEWTGPTYGTCRDAVWVAQKFKEMSRRRDILPWTFHREVAALPPEEADAILDWAERGDDGKPRTIREVREQVKRRKTNSVQEWTGSQLERKVRVEDGEIVLANMTSDENGLSVDNALITWAESENLAIRIDRQSDWGNPYEVDADGTREEVIGWYREYFAHKRSLHKRLKELAEKRVLLCWCYPKPCHGHFLLEQLNGR